MPVRLLHYRPWRGPLRPPAWSVWPIARSALGLLLGRRLFWGLYALSLLPFLLFFFGTYLLSWAQMQTQGQKIAFGPISVEPDAMLALIQKGLQLDGRAEMYRNLFQYQGPMLLVMLAMSGAVLVGNDFRFRSLPFFLARPLAPWHYLLGKCLAVGILIQVIATLPALVLFVRDRLIQGWEAPADECRLLLGILGHGMVLMVGLSITLVAFAAWLRRPVPLVMIWTSVFLFPRLLANALVDGLNYHPLWRLFDLWSNLTILGNLCLGAENPSDRPGWPLAGLVLGAVCILCLIWLKRQARAVEIVR